MSETPPFTLLAACTIVALLVSLCIGVARWQQPGGKAIALVAGVLLLLLVGVVAAVFFTVASGRMG